MQHARARVEYDSAIPGPPHVGGSQGKRGSVLVQQRRHGARGCRSEPNCFVRSATRAPRDNKDGFGRRRRGRRGDRVPRVAETLLLNEQRGETCSSLFTRPVTSLGSSREGRIFKRTRVAGLSTASHRVLLCNLLFASLHGESTNERHRLSDSKSRSQ